MCAIYVANFEGDARKRSQNGSLECQCNRLKVSITLLAVCNREPSHSSSNNGNNPIITIDLSPLTSLITHFQLHAELSYQTIIRIPVAIIAININLNRHRIRVHTTAQQSRAQSERKNKISHYTMTPTFRHFNLKSRELLSTATNTHTHTAWHAHVYSQSHTIE